MDNLELKEFKQYCLSRGIINPDGIISEEKLKTISLEEAKMVTENTSNFIEVVVQEAAKVGAI